MITLRVKVRGTVEPVVIALRVSEGGIPAVITEERHCGASGNSTEGLGERHSSGDNTKG